MRTAPAAMTALVLSAVLASAAPGAGERPAVGNVERVQPQARATYDAETRTLVIDNEVFYEDLLETGAGARLAVTLADGTDLTLGENASLRVDSFVYLPDGRTGKLGVTVLEGAFLFVGGETEKMEHSQVEIDTPVATLGVRGTTVWGGMIDGSFGVLVTEGQVTVRNQAGELNLGPGQGTQIEAADALPSPAKTWPEAKVQRALDTVRFAHD